MKILVVGSGGREDTLCWKLAQSEQVEKLYCAPGNGGTERWAENIALKGVREVARFAEREGIDLTVVGPEAPLSEGIVDLFEERRLKIFGPKRDAAKLETSKVFAKEFMRKNSIPTADFEIFEERDKILNYIFNKNYPIVIKADGLCGGKGVFVCKNRGEAERAVKALMEDKIFGKAGERVVIEECLFGEEASYLAFVDGEDFLPMVSAQDHKPIFDGDKGPNTGGMGAYSPTGIVTQRTEDMIKREILERAIKGLLEIGIEFKGVLYLGLMITQDGPKVLEFNVRFGDPEAQVVLTRLKSDILEPIMACIDGGLSEVELCWDKRSTLCTILASDGYPGDYEKGKRIGGLEEVERLEDILVFHSGTERKDGEFFTKGGRVLGITGYGNDIKSAKNKVYNAISKVKFENIYFRSDIGEKEIKRGNR